jgi:hypothetical protein
MFTTVSQTLVQQDAALEAAGVMKTFSDTMSNTDAGTSAGCRRTESVTHK